MQLPGRNSYRVHEDRDSKPAKRQRKTPLNFRENTAYHKEATFLSKHNCLNNRNCLNKHNNDLIL